MEFLYYTIAGILLYVISDKTLNRIEVARGKRFENRSLIFLVIIMVLAVGSFKAVEYITQDIPPPAVEANQKSAEPSK